MKVKKKKTRITVNGSVDVSQDCVGSFFLDSGAHSLFTREVIKKKHRAGYSFYESKKFWAYVDAYANFVKRHKKDIDFYVNVDAIFNPQKSWEVLKYLEQEHGLSPLPVIHHGTDLKWLDRHLEAGYTYIGLGGLGQEVSTREYFAWANQVYERICPAPSHLPLVKTHGFAMTGYDLIVRYPWYCMTEEHEILTQQGWKGQNELKVGDLVLAFDDGNCEWQPILDKPVFEVEDIPLVRMDSRRLNNFSARVTPNHRWRVQDKHGVWSWQTTDSLNNHRIPRAGYYKGPEKKTYSTMLVKLMAWYWTEGHIKRRTKDKPYRKDSIAISQSLSANPKKVQMIRDLLQKCGEKYCESTSIRRSGKTRLPGRKEVTFELYGRMRDKLLTLAPNKEIPLSFLMELTRKQLRIFVKTSILADGWQRMVGRPSSGLRPTFSIRQAWGKNIDTFRIACLLAGYPTTKKVETDTSGNPNRAGHSALLESSNKKDIYSSRIAKRYTTHTGKIWCITVKSGAFFTRCKERIYVTGNSTDSASWVKAGGFGMIMVPHRRGGEFIYDEKPYNVITSNDSPCSTSGERKHLAAFTPAQKEVIFDWLERINIPLGSTRINSKGQVEMVDWGVVSHHSARKIANLKFFQALCASLPEWPWPFRLKKQKGSFAF